MDEKRKVWAELGAEKRRKRKESAQDRARKANQTIKERKQGIEQNVDHSAQTEPQRVDVGVQVMPKKRDAGTQTSAEGLDALISAKNEIAMLRECLRELSARNQELEQKLTTKTTNFLQKNARKPRKLIISKSVKLHEEALNKLEEWTKKFFDRWQWLKRFEPRVASNTPKLHWLCCHLTEFARRRRWFALVSEQCIEHIHSHFDRLAPRYKNTGSEERMMMKLARHQAILNSLHALGHEDEGRNSDENESPTPIADENDPPSGRRMTQ
uniref:Transposase n=1 Tax=Globodera pallida TaxID=36090 RepID=A0A183BP58_GLOPA